MTPTLKRYYKTDWWRYRSCQCLEDAGWVCEYVGCNRTAEQAHHTNYACLYHEEREDLMALCGYHHMVIHGIRKPANDNEPTMWEWFDKAA